MRSAARWFSLDQASAKNLSIIYKIKEPIYDPRFIHTSIYGINEKMHEYFQIV